jgi:hypothetical protein
MDPTMIIMIVAMVGIFYFFMIRPESKKKKRLAEMRESLSVGERLSAAYLARSSRSAMRRSHLRQVRTGCVFKSPSGQFQP